MSKLYIKKKGQAEFCLSDKLPSVSLLELKMSAPQITPSYQQVQGSDGQLLQTVAYNSSTANVSLFVRNDNYSEYLLTKNALQSELYTREPIRLRASDEPAKAMWVLANPSDINTVGKSDDAQVSFSFTVISGTRLTPFNSDELEDNKDKLQFGMNLDLDNLPKYQFTDRQFTVFNPSDVVIDPYIQNHTLVIKIKGNGDDVTVTNNTNGTSFTVDESITDSDVLVMDGVTLSLNGETGAVSTDFGNLTLERGNNDITITGLSDQSVTFSFPFLYF